MIIQYSEHAKNDLRNIYEYIANTLFAPEAAKSITTNITSAIHKIQFLPEKYPIYRYALAKTPLIRYFPVKNYIVFYSFDESLETIFIIRIIYGGRDIMSELNNYQ